MWRLASPSRPCGFIPELPHLLLRLQPCPLGEDLITERVVGFIEVVLTHHPHPDFLVGSQLPMNRFAVVCRQHRIWMNTYLQPWVRMFSIIKVFKSQMRQSPSNLLRMSSIPRAVAVGCGTSV